MDLYLKRPEKTECRAIGTVYKKGGDRMASWKCGSCGYTFKADTPPDKCPSCKQKCEFLDNTCYTPDCNHKGTDDRIK